MASELPALLEKVEKVAQGEAEFDTLEELAFGTGLVINYLIRLNQKNKTYGVLERFLPQTGGKFGQVQEGIVKYIATQIPDCTFQPGGKFETLAARVLACGQEKEDLSPSFRKFIWAGCFAENILLK